MMVLINSKFEEEGAEAYKKEITLCPYPEVSAEGISWQAGWLAAADIHSPADVRIKLINYERQLRPFIQGMLAK